MRYRVDYSINDEDDPIEYTVDGSELNYEYIRVFMHSYGYYTGHYNKLDWVEINVTRSRYD